MSDNNNVENDNDSDYVYLKRPYLFNIRYNSRQVWNKLPEEDILCLTFEICSSNVFDSFYLCRLDTFV